MKKLSDLTIILQGRCEESQLKLWIDNHYDFNVILSTWIDFDTSLEIPSHWKIIKSEYPNRYASWQNLDFQLTSTLNGLSNVNTEYVLKVRADEYWYNIEHLYERMISDPDKILCGSAFFRMPDDVWAYHISDHILCGKTSEISIMFNEAHRNMIENYTWCHCPECILGYAYVSIKENFDRSKLRDYVTIPDSLYLKKWFHIIDVNELSPFVLTQLSETGRIYYRDFFDGCGCITKL
jgi:hypothetical protein